MPYTGYGSTSWIRVLGRVLLTRTSPNGLDPNPRIRGWRSFISVPVENAKVDVTIGEQRHTVTADRSGSSMRSVPISLSPGWHTIGLQAENPGSEPTIRSAADGPRSTWSIRQPGFGIVSDIDDTVMVTALPRPLLAAWHTFVVNEHARPTTPGMPVLYERLARAYPDSPVIYLSTGAWNVAPTLTRFLVPQPLSRRRLCCSPTGGRPRTAGSAAAASTSASSLERLAAEFPNIKWLLIGDDGQHDEAIYGDFVCSHPDRVAAVCIRQLSPGEAVLAGSCLQDSRRAHRLNGSLAVRPGRFSVRRETERARFARGRRKATDGRVAAGTKINGVFRGRPLLKMGGSATPLSY